MSRPTTVLFLVANPIRVQPLQFYEECRTIEDKIRAARFREQIRFRSRWAARTDDLLQALNEDMPSVLHFSGHGAGDQGLCFQSDDGSIHSVSAYSLAQVIQAAGACLAVVILNACFSEVQARALVAQVPCVIGMSNAIGDEAAINYAASFYRALAFGRSVANAHQQGVAAIDVSSTGGTTRDATLAEAGSSSSIPQLFTRTGVDADRIYVAGEPQIPRPCNIAIKARLRNLHGDVIIRLTEELRSVSDDLSLLITDDEDIDDE